jgi:hypothetical protein
MKWALATVLAIAALGFLAVGIRSFVGLFMFMNGWG